VDDQLGNLVSCLIVDVGKIKSAQTHLDEPTHPVQHILIVLINVNCVGNLNYLSQRSIHDAHDLILEARSITELD